MAEKLQAGSIGWADLTVPDAETVRHFYEAVAGWLPGPVDMGGYDDYCMSPPGGGSPVAGVCHRRGENAALPPVWLIYITVANLEDSLRQCRGLGGKILAGPKEMGGGNQYAVIEDPAGAVCALYQPAFSTNTVP